MSDDMDKARDMVRSVREALAQAPPCDECQRQVVPLYECDKCKRKTCEDCTFEDGESLICMACEGIKGRPVMADKERNWQQELSLAESEMIDRIDEALQQAAAEGRAARRKVVDDLLAELATAGAQLAALVEAAGPFVEYANGADFLRRHRSPEGDDEFEVGSAGDDSPLTVGHCRRLRDAVAAVKGGGE